MAAAQPAFATCVVVQWSAPPDLMDQFRHPMLVVVLRAGSMRVPVVSIHPYNYSFVGSAAGMYKT
jgi:hypothetical protein